MHYHYKSIHGINIFTGNAEALICQPWYCFTAFRLPVICFVI